MVLIQRAHWTWATMPNKSDALALHRPIQMIVLQLKVAVWLEEADWREKAMPQIYHNAYHPENNELRRQHDSRVTKVSKL